MALTLGKALMHESRTRPGVLQPTETDRNPDMCLFFVHVSVVHCRSPGCLVSPNQLYFICMQSDANLVLFNSARRAIW